MRVSLSLFARKAVTGRYACHRIYADSILSVAQSLPSEIRHLRVGEVGAGHIRRVKNGSRHIGVLGNQIYVRKVI